MLHEVSKRLSIMVQMPIRNAESFQLVYYTKGAEYQEHCDAFNYDLPEGKKHWEPGGQRMITALAYLNDVEDGGGTGFPKLDIEISPNKGDVLVLIVSKAPMKQTTIHCMQDFLSFQERNGLLIFGSERDRFTSYFSLSDDWLMIMLYK